MSTLTCSAAAESKKLSTASAAHATVHHHPYQLLDPCCKQRLCSDTSASQSVSAMVSLAGIVLHWCQCCTVLLVLHCNKIITSVAPILPTALHPGSSTCCMYRRHISLVRLAASMTDAATPPSAGIEQEHIVTVWLQLRVHTWMLRLDPCMRHNAP